jgi:hypothetical protein
MKYSIRHKTTYSALTIFLGWYPFICQKDVIRIT